LKDITIRIDKFLSSSGACSRRAVDEFLKQNTVTVNGKKVDEAGSRITPEKDRILINGHSPKKPDLHYFMLNKPKGIITTASDEYGRDNVISFINTRLRIFPIGRLDKDTHGLILLTNDGELTNHLIHPKYHVPKIYEAKIAHILLPHQLDSLRKGVMLEDGLTMPADVKIIKKYKEYSIIQITLHEGKKRQIRRMCEALQVVLLDLQRVQFGPLVLGDLPIGKYRKLTPSEIKMLKSLGN
jgi:pseudouridine synthase